jgi:hypothetical protein
LTLTLIGPHALEGVDTSGAGWYRGWQPHDDWVKKRCRSFATAASGCMRVSSGSAQQRKDCARAVDAQL